MATTYDHIAGQSVERLAALSDGIFGVAMTLLLLDLHTPAKEIIHSESDLVGALWGLAPNLLVYLMSFLTLGIYWVGQQTQLNYLIRSDRHLTWIHLAFLFAVTIMPFSTRLLADYIEYRTALIAYWFNIFVLGARFTPRGSAPTAAISSNPRPRSKSGAPCAAGSCAARPITPSRRRCASSTPTSASVASS